MPITPTVFRPIRSNDFQQRTFKAYKNYRITSIGFTTASGYIHHNALYEKMPFHVGDGTYDYPVNALDGTNQHVIWHSLNHRYYGHPYDAAKSAELTNPSETSKNLYLSASALIAPYLEVGERIKPGSVTATFSAPVSYTLHDDGKGNLLDSSINTSSFASASRNIFYMSFNKEFETRGPIQSQYNIPQSRFKRDFLGKGYSNAWNSYMGHSYNYGTDDSKHQIRVPHEEKFNRFNRTDDWTISFWHQFDAAGGPRPIISKAGIREETYFDVKDSVTKTRDNVRSMPAITESYAKIRTPFVIGVNPKRESSTNHSASYHFQASDGSTLIHISSSLDDWTEESQFNGSTILKPIYWTHITVRNSASMCQIFIDGKPSGTSGSLPAGITSNRDDIIIGAFISGSQNLGSSTLCNVAEIRMYDYATSNLEIESLASNHYLTGSMLQTNVVGNVFYRNGEIVVSHPNYYKYNSGSGAFGETFDITYKGTHTIYENEVLVRVPKDQFNVSMNPSATYTPATNKLLSQTEQFNTLPGELQKTMFVSGTAKPYISTIGLYNDAAQLVAVSKLAQPIQKRDDVDMNFIVRWDY